MILLATVCLGVGSAVISEVRRLVRRGRTVIQLTAAGWDAPVPYWPAEADEILATHADLLAALCWGCRGDGACVCVTQCGQPECVGGFSDEDIEWLRALTAAEGTDQ